MSDKLLADFGTYVGNGQSKAEPNGTCFSYQVLGGNYVPEILEPHLGHNIKITTEKY